MLSHASLQALAAVRRISSSLLPEYDTLKQQRAKSQECEQQASERLAQMEKQQESLMETHRVLQKAFQQVSTERGGSANGIKGFHLLWRDVCRLLYRCDSMDLL